MFALIPAAGSGSRAASAIAKQYALLAGRPMLWHAIRAVCVPPVQSVFVVLAPDDKAFASHDWSAFGDKLEPLYCGGESRHDSVHNGLVATMMEEVDAADWMLVHDAARPCLRADDLGRLLAIGQAHPVGALLAAPVRDTLKRADATGHSQGTESRDGLWRALTPQLFRRGGLTRALLAALHAGVRITDEAMALERLGLRPCLVEGREDNLKVTTPADLALAEFLLARKE